MGHAGAIVSGGTGTAAEKIAAFQKAGVPVADLPSQIPGLVQAALAGLRRNGKRTKAKSKAKAKAKAKPKAKSKSKSKPKQAKRPARKARPRKLK